MENLHFNNSSHDSSRQVGDQFLISGSPQKNFGRIGKWASGNLQPRKCATKIKVQFLLMFIVYGIHVHVYAIKIQM